MRYRLAFVLALLFVASFSSAQLKVQLDFGGKGNREVWSGTEFRVPDDSLTTDAATYDLPLGEIGPETKVFVWDRESGNLAFKPASQIAGTWKLTPADFKRIGRVQVQVRSEGKPVSAAAVKLKDAAGTRTAQLDPTSEGTVSFVGVMPGSVSVSVEYNSDGKPADPYSVKQDLALKRSKADPVIGIDLADPGVATIETPAPANTDANAAATPAQGGGAAKPAPKPNVLGSIVVYLVALGIALGLGYLAMQYMKKNPKLVGDKLKQLGVDIPDPQDQANAAVQSQTPPQATPITPPPPEKIILDDATPEPIGAAPASVPMSVATGQPRLVMANGDEFELPEGETTVGRDVGLGLSLVTESTVSRNHASVVRQGSEVRVRDNGSTNGTWVNGARIQAEATLRPGDAVQFGEVRFRYEA